jgi:hypothetical protein
MSSAMDKQQAQDTIRAVQSALTLASTALREVKMNESMNNIAALNNLLGQFATNAYLDVLAPLWRAFPELEPAEMQQPQELRQGLSDVSIAALSQFELAANVALTHVKSLATESSVVQISQADNLNASLESIIEFRLKNT